MALSINLHRNTRRSAGNRLWKAAVKLIDLSGVFIGDNDTDGWPTTSPLPRQSEGLGLGNGGIGDR